MGLAAVPTKAAIAAAVLALAVVAAYASSVVFEAAVGVKIRVSRPVETQVEVSVETPAGARTVRLGGFSLPNATWVLSGHVLVRKEGNFTIVASAALTVKNLDTGRTYTFYIPCLLAEGEPCYEPMVVPVPVKLDPGNYTADLLLRWAKASGEGYAVVKVYLEQASMWVTPGG